MATHTLDKVMKAFRELHGTHRCMPLFRSRTQDPEAEYPATTWQQKFIPDLSKKTDEYKKVVKPYHVYDIPKNVMIDMSNKVRAWVATASPEIKKYVHIDEVSEEEWLALEAALRETRVMSFADKDHRAAKSPKSPKAPKSPNAPKAPKAPKSPKAPKVPKTSIDPKAKPATVADFARAMTKALCIINEHDASLVDAAAGTSGKKRAREDSESMEGDDVIENKKVENARESLSENCKQFAELLKSPDAIMKLVARCPDMQQQLLAAPAPEPRAAAAADA
jgi:hypothetical protein